MMMSMMTMFRELGEEGEYDLISDEECTTDDECGVSRICISHLASWNNRTVSTCGCNLWYGWQGENCDEYSATTYYSIFYSLLQILVSFIFFVIISIDLFQLLRVFGVKRLRLNASLVTLLCLFGGFFSLLTWRLLYLLGASIPAANDRLLQGDSKPPEGTVTFSSASRPFVVTTQFFLFASALTVSVLWVEICDASRSMHVKLVDNVNRYRRTVQVLVTLFSTGVVTIAIVGKFDLFATWAMPFLIIVICFYILGRHRLLKLLKESLNSSHAGGNASSNRPQLSEASSDLESGSSSGGFWFRSRARSGPKKPKTRESRTRRAMLSIDRTAKHVIGGFSLIIVAGIVWFALVELPEASWIEYADPEGHSIPPVLIVASFLPWGMIWALAGIALYSHRNTRKLIKKELGVMHSSLELDQSLTPSSLGGTNMTWNAPFGAHESLAEEDLPATRPIKPPTSQAPQAPSSPPPPGPLH